jgi:esterase/lipase superfamily enzyme
MFLVTNRQLSSQQDGTCRLGDKPNTKGPHELRVVEASRKNKQWVLKAVPDRLSREMKVEVGLPVSKSAFGGDYVAAKLLKRIRDRKRNLLFFVHGFNNDVDAVLDRAETLAANYGVEVLPFTWPANGGGVHGVLSYKSDKRDARASVGALDRVLQKIYGHLNRFNETLMEQTRAEAEKRFPENHEKRQVFIAKALEAGCPFKVNMLLHSMGNYLYKQVLGSSVYHGDLLLFDNVVMAAADANNEDHARWVDRINCRCRLYITINEDDYALAASRAKSGEDQKARLGHFPHNLNAKRAVYVDFTGVSKVGRSHAYFEGEAIANAKVQTFFQKVLNGQRTENDPGLLHYDAATNMHTFR